MNDSNRDLELLELITQDNLDKDIMEEVAARSSDPVFKLEYKKALALREVIIVSTHKSLKEELKAVDQHLIAQKQKWNTIKLAIAALIILTVVAFLYSAYAEEREALPADLYAMYYAPHPNSVDPLTKGSDDLSLSATQQYELGKYDEAIILLTKVRLDETAEWYLAQSYLANQNWESASKYFDNIITQEGKYSSNAKWFRALIHLQQNNVKEAKILLQEVISNSNNGYRTKAVDLLDEL